MVYRALADSVLVLHFAFILFAVGGGLLALRLRWIPLLQLPAAIWAVWIEISSSICPLTLLENAFRQAAGDAGYAGGFIEQHLLPVVYPSGLSHPVQLVLAALVLLANAAVYWGVWRRSRGRAAA